MSKLSPILAPEADRAHYVAQATLCGLASLMALALAWAGWHGAFPGTERVFASDPASTVPVNMPAVTTGSIAALPPTVGLPSNVTPVNSLPAPLPALDPARMPMPETPVSLPPSLPPMASLTSPKTLLPSPDAVPLPGKPIANPQAREMVDAGREVRRLGDMQAALESFRAADLREPQNAEIMSEIALTYEGMGLADKAELAWQNVVSLGEGLAGSYFGLAQSKLADREASKKTLEDVRPLGIGSCQVLPDKTVTKGQKVVLRIPLIAVPGAVIDATQVDLHVYFFDKLSDGSIAPTHADPPTFDWITSPVTWKDGKEELVDVAYHMPELNAEELRNLGHRVYYGYVVKLFYQNRFMGEQAEPHSLLDFRPPGAGPAGAENPLFPKN